MSESIPIVAGGIPPFPDFEVAESVFDRDMMGDYRNQDLWREAPKASRREIGVAIAQFG